MKMTYGEFKARIEELAGEISDCIGSTEPSEGLDDEGLRSFVDARYNAIAVVNAMVEDITDSFGQFLDD